MSRRTRRAIREAFGYVARLVQVRVHDEALPAQRSPRLLEVAASPEAASPARGRSARETSRRVFRPARVSCIEHGRNHQREPRRGAPQDFTNLLPRTRRQNPPVARTGDFMSISRCRQRDVGINIQVDYSSHVIMLNKSAKICGNRTEYENSTPCFRRQNRPKPDFGTIRKVEVRRMCRLARKLLAVVLAAAALCRCTDAAQNLYSPVNGQVLGPAGRCWNSTGCGRSKRARLPVPLPRPRADDMKSGTVPQIEGQSRWMTRMADFASDRRASGAGDFNASARTMCFPPPARAFSDDEIGGELPRA